MRAVLGSPQKPAMVIQVLFDWVANTIEHYKSVKGLVYYNNGHGSRSMYNVRSRWYNRYVQWLVYIYIYIYTWQACFMRVWHESRLYSARCVTKRAVTENTKTDLIRKFNKIMLPRKLQNAGNFRETTKTFFVLIVYFCFCLWIYEKKLFANVTLLIFPPLLKETQFATEI